MILNLVCKSDIKEVHDNISYLLFEKKVHGDAETVYHTLIISFKLIATIIQDRTTHVQKGKPP